MGGEVREELGSAFGGLGGALRFRPQLLLRRCPRVAPRAPHERLADGEGGLSHALAPGRAVLREGAPSGPHACNNHDMPARLGTSVEARGNMAVKWILLLALVLFAPALAFGNGGECTVYPSGTTQTGTAAFGRADCADSTNDDKPLLFDAHLEKSEEVLSGKTQADTAAFGGQAASGSAA